jgi:N-succinyldiaminopimelate aminotransferase
VVTHRVSRTSAALRPFGTTIFAEMSELARRHDAINLGQGFPDFDGPDSIKQAAITALQHQPNQYARSQGLPALCEALCRKLKRQYGIVRDPQTEVAVFSGATEALAAAIFGLVERGDEVVVFEPVYDSYLPLLSLVGATPRIASLRWPDFALDREAVTALFSDKTKLLLLNTPHNPTGKVFSASDLRFLANLCDRHDVIVVTDEVYEHITFDAVHVPMASLSGFEERVLTLSSTGKTFSMTGWKIGTAHGAAPLVAAAQAAHQFLTFSTATPLQHAMAMALDLPEAFYVELKAEYAQRRAALLDALERAGLPTFAPQGTYFSLSHIGHLEFPDDRAFAHYLARKVGVACIPCSAFYPTGRREDRQLARFAFCKQIETLSLAGMRLAELAHLNPG